MIRVEQDGRVAVLNLDRPEKKNALTPGMLAELSEKAREVRAQETGAIVLAGVGSVFCSGFDLSLCRDDAGMVLTSLLSGLSSAVRVLRRQQMPIVVAAHGAAIAGGCALLGAGDVVVVDEGARLGYPAVRLGISPAVTAPFLVQGIGQGQARARLLNSDLISGREAFETGLAHECVKTPEAVLARSMTIARELADKPRAGLLATKRWLNELDGSDSDPDANAALAASLSCVGTDEQRSLLSALWKAKA